MNNNLTEFLKEILSNCEVTEGGIISFESSFINSDPQARKYFDMVLKLKGQWMNAIDIYSHFYTILSDETWELYYEKISTPKKITTFFSEKFIDELCDKIITSLKSIPRAYSIFFELSSATKFDEKELNLADGIQLFEAGADNKFPGLPKMGLLTHSDKWSRSIKPLIEKNYNLFLDLIFHLLPKSNLPKNSQELLSGILAALNSLSTDVEDIIDKLQEGRLYLRIDVKGYIGWASAQGSKTFLKAYSRFKQAVVLGILSGIFTIQNNRKELPLSTPIIYIYENSKSEKRGIRTLQLPHYDSNLLSKLIIGKTFSNGKRTAKQILESSQFQQFITLLKTQNRDEYLQHIKTAIEWAYDSLSNTNKTIAFLQACIGIEALLGDDDSRENTTKILAERCAYLLADTIARRKQLKKDFKKIYDVRSKIVHGREENLSADQSRYLVYSQKLLGHLISKEMSKAF